MNLVDNVLPETSDLLLYLPLVGLVPDLHKIHPLPSLIVPLDVRGCDIQVAKIWHNDTGAIMQLKQVPSPTQ